MPKYCTCLDNGNMARIGYSYSQFQLLTVQEVPYLIYILATSLSRVSWDINPASSTGSKFLSRSLLYFLDVFLHRSCACGAPLPCGGSSRPELLTQCTFHPFVKARDTL